MLRRPLLTFTLALALAAAFCFGLTRLFQLRYAAGDVYAPYSSLRADPLGAKVLHDALAELPGVTVRRNFQPLKKLQPGQPVTLVYAGVRRHSYWTPRELQEFESLVFGGGSRAVFAFYPVSHLTSAMEERREADDELAKKKTQEEEDEKKTKGEEAKTKEEKPKTKEEGAKAKPKNEEERERDRTFLSFDEVAKQFGFAFELLPPGEDRQSFEHHAEVVENDVPLEPKITWHSARCFKDLAPEWQVLYRSRGKPVLIERAYGRGSIVLAADSYFLSNEALRDERHPQLLTRIFSGPPLIVFDEEHLGMSDDMGIVQLALKYRLHGVFAGLALLAALFVWKNATRFVPARADDALAADAVAGKDFAHGFSNLLRRSIPPKELLAVCAHEWRTAATHPDRAVAAVEEIAAREAALPPKQRNAVAAYQAIATTLNRKVKRTK